MHKQTNSFFACAFTIACFIGLLVSPAAAAANSKVRSTSSASNPNYGEALEIAPPLINLTVSPGQTLTTRIYLRDVSSGPLVVTGQANDFVAAGEDGTPKILLGNSAANDPYSMKSWIEPPVSLDLIPKEIKTMAITVRVPANASPGGHYGVIRFTATPPSLKGTGVSLSTSLGALMLLTVTGKITHSLSVQEFSVNHAGKTGSLFQSGPLNFVERIKNNGNVHEEPTGLVRVYDMFGRELAAVGVNAPPKNVLPASIRKFSEALNESVIGNKRLFGHYRAVMMVTYGPNDKQTLSAVLRFWVIPYRLIAIVIILLVIAFFIFRFLIRRYNRHILGKAYRPRRH